MLKNASRIVDRSNSDIAEEALREWLVKNNLLETYQVTITESKVVLSKTGDGLQILEIIDLNGVPPQEIAQNYKRKLQAPVRLVIQEKTTWPKNRL